jgi:hypothetical protein
VDERPAEPSEGAVPAPYLAPFGYLSAPSLVDRSWLLDPAAQQVAVEVFVSTSHSDPPPTEVVAPAAGLGSAVLSRVSWSAIFAGIVLVLPVEVLLDLLGAGVGLGLVKPSGGGTPNASNFGTGAGIWWLVSTVIALIFGCYVAARLGGVASRWDGVLHGLVIWGGAVLITVYLLTTAIGGVIGGAFSVLGGTLSAAGQGIKSAVPELSTAAGVSPDLLQQQAQAYLQPTNPDPATMSPQDAQKEIARLLPDLAAGGDRYEQAKQRVIDIMAAQLKISRDDAAKRFDQAQAQVSQTKEQAMQTTKSAAIQSAAVASRASFVAFTALLIGAVAAGAGGALASPQPPFARWMIRSQGKV